MVEHIENLLKILSSQDADTSHENSEERLQQFCQQLQSTDLKKRRIAIHALGEMQDPRAVPDLLDTLNVSDRLIQRDVIESLGRIGDPRAVPVLLNMLQERDWFVKQAAIEALGLIGDSAAIPGLVAALHDADKWVATEAAEALGTMGHAEAMPALLEVLHSDDLINSLTESASHKKEPVEKEAMVEIGTFYHEIRDLRCAVVWALGQLGNNRVIEHLIKVMQTDPDPMVSNGAMEALQQHGTPPALVAVQQWQRQQHATEKEQQ